MKMPEFHKAYPDALVEHPSRVARRKSRLLGHPEFAPEVDPLGDTIRCLLEEYKIMVLYGKMTLYEYTMRQHAFVDLRVKRGERAVTTLGWKALRARLREITNGKAVLLANKVIQAKEGGKPLTRKPNRNVDPE